MQVLLYILLALQLLSGVLAFFLFVTNVWYLAIIFLVVALLQSVLILVVIDNKNRVRYLEFYTDNIISKLKKLESPSNISENAPAPPINQNPNVAIGTWECIKCGTVNKIGTTNCSNCKADYIPEINPTSNPNDKKKRISRWIKFK